MSNRTQEILASAAAPVADDAVRMESPPDGTITLPGGGYIDPKSGILHDKAVVREINGEDEEVLARNDANRNRARYIKQLLGRCVESIGDFERPSEEILSSLLIGDRDALVHQIRIVTYGKTVKVHGTCPHCVTGLDIELDLTVDVPFRKLAKPVDDRIIEVELRNRGMAVLTLATGFDQDAVYALTAPTIPEMNTALLGQCVRSINGTHSTGVGTARSLGAADREKLLEALIEKQPGPRYDEMEERCVGCDRDFPVRLDLLDLFRL